MSHTEPPQPQPSRDKMLARFYDLEYRGYTDDLDFYVQHASALDPRKKLPVLELGCGTGRVLIALAQAGFNVVGVDSSEGMLSVCEEHVRSRGLGSKVTLLCSDIRQMPSMPQAPFNLAFCALNTFAYLQSTEDQLAMLRAVHPLLVQHGILVLDLIPPFPHLLPPSDMELVHQGSFLDEGTGATIHKLVSGVAEHSRQTHVITIFYDREAQDGALSRLTHRVAMRWTGRYEMELLLQQAGYRVEKVYGGYELDEFGEGSERMIFVART